MPRDKLISIRVDQKLYNKFIKIVDEHTKVYDSWGSRKMYDYCDPLLPHHYNKFTIADLLEIALKEYIDKHTEIKK